MILAKSDGTTLAQHIEDCLHIWEQLKIALPALPKVTLLPNYWEILFAAIYLHDFGKSQNEFQKVLLKHKNFWELQRHELYSIPFVDKLNLDEEVKELIKRVILGHHKDFYTLYSEHYKDTETLNFEYRQKWRDKNLKAHPEDFHYNLRARIKVQDLQEIITAFKEAASKYSVKNVCLDRKTSFVDQPNPYHDIAKVKQEFDNNSTAYFTNMLLWGSLKICDHYGSAGVKKIRIFNDQHFSFLDNLQVKFGDFYEHQKACFGSNGNSILIAPTGSGKTEAAVGWLRKELKSEQGRAFYILPYTASINAMHKRLSKDMDSVSENELSTIIGIQHGNLPPYIATYFESVMEIIDTRERNKNIKNLKEQFKRLEHPIKITTPFQLLKHFYAVKGFEMGLVQLVGAKLIFDEIHAYDPVTFAQILVMLGFLTTHFRCSSLIMTATLPTFLLNELKAALNIQAEIRAETKFLQNNIRHSIHLVEKTIEEIISNLFNYYNDGKRIIVVCNTVQRAQEVSETLQSDMSIPSESIVLLHGRFNARDRLKNEKRAFDSNTRILVGTQAIEVSLDIDYDVMFTEPAPLDALLQRFGRINRKGRNAAYPVYVCKIGGPNDHYIYPEQIVENTLNVLQGVDVLQEQKIQELLDRVYPDWLPKQKHEFETTMQAFRESVASLQPYSAHKEKEQDFYEKFTGIQVLPAKYFIEYKDLIEKYDFIGAEQLLVNIYQGMYFRLKNNPEGSQIEKRVIDVIRENDKIERHFVIVAKCEYDSSKGMTDEFEDISEDSFL